MAEWFTRPLSSLVMFGMATASARATGGLRPGGRNSFSSGQSHVNSSFAPIGTDETGVLSPFVRLAV